MFRKPAGQVLRMPAAGARYQKQVSCTWYESRRTTSLPDTFGVLSEDTRV